MKKAKKIKYRVGQVIHGWQVERVRIIKRINTQFIELKHRSTGARYVHLANPDTNSAWALTFKTIPHDSSGVAHILEHTALTGSRKFPLRDPFFSMLRRSRQSFMNAFTSEDWTAYLFASQNEKDFFNLLAIYLDAAFFPILSNLNFQQEGHRLNYVGKNLVREGVVYNEMKGAMSSVDRLMTEYIKEQLHPQTSYRFNSGGDPAAIKTLTHANLKKFHQSHYHPSNAWFYSYGAIDLEKILKFVNQEALEEYGRQNTDFSIKKEPKWTKPRQITRYYPVSSLDKNTHHCQATIAWLLGGVENSYEMLLLELLENILLSHPAAPLRQVLMNSELGSDLSDNAGLIKEYRQAVFTAGLKGIKTGQVKQVQNLVISTLKELARKGIDQELVKIAWHQLQISKREISNQPYPHGIKEWLDMIGPWLHQGDPFELIEMDKAIQKLKIRIKTPRFLEKQIARLFLDNTHELFFTLAPSGKLEKEKEIKEQAELKKLDKKLSKPAKEKIKQTNRALLKLQDQKEDFSCLPSLRLSDIKTRVEKVVSKRAKAAPIYEFKQTTNGLSYFMSAIDINSLDKKDWPLLPIFCYLLPKIGTTKKNYEALARAISLSSGGISASPLVTSKLNPLPQVLPMILFQAKLLESKINPLFDLVKEIWLSSDFGDELRLKQFLSEYQARYASGIVDNGHVYALSLASRNLSSVKAQQEKWQGIGQYMEIKKINETIKKQGAESLKEDFINISNNLFTQANVKMALIGEAEANKKGQKKLNQLYDGLPKGPKNKIQDFKYDKKQVWEAWTSNTAVSFVACALPVVNLHSPEAAPLLIASKILSRNYLHNLIREKGGAYGGFARYDYLEGVFQMASYRDPHILLTLEAFDAATKLLAQGKITREMTEEAIIQAITDIERPDAPAEKGEKAFLRELVGLTDAQRERFKKQILKVQPGDVKKVSKKYLVEPTARGSVAVISNLDKIRTVNKKMKKKFTVREI